MQRHLKNLAVPHEGNEYRPHALRPRGVVFLGIVALVFLGLALLTSYIVPRSDFLAAVIPEVLIDLTNDDRLANGLGQLSYNSTLAEAAQLKANHMAENGYFSHNSPDGVTPWFWFTEAGYEFSSAGENLAVHFTDSEDVADAWMNSPGHRANILNNNFTEIGIATARGRLDGYNTVFVVQLFGRPAPGSVAAASTSETEQAEPEAAEPAEVVPAEEPEPEPEPEPVESYEVIEETDTFIAVEVPEPADEPAEPPATDDTSGTVGIQDEPTDAVGLLEPQSTPFERLLASPYHIVQWAYLILMLFIVIVLILTIVIEFEKQHPKNVLYGVALLLFVIFLLYITRTHVFTDALIV